ncbi:DNA repair protein RecO [Rhizobium alvei]|uniref:DNA repair protein RecO n=1 Tax=Rhizobium alvei TaxID=1132659 RepID=A0ABT8YFF9_9HYPH|nr:DNA repair protein RecO [Rhizobium alvei]MDO6962435.1 DNA repair protein RecO [Rhizobium alvei]
MDWSDRAIVLGVRRHGESSVIAEVMTQTRGRHLGMVRNGKSRTMAALLQPGNLVDVTWRARLDEHLGNFSMEPISYRAAQLMERAASLHGVQALAALLRLLPERDPHPHLFEMLDVVLDHLQTPAEAGELYVRFELAVLNDLGFGLDLAQCAATGSREDLFYVSPKSGRAVCREAGLPYHDKMFVLPDFLKPTSNKAAKPDGLMDAFRLTQYFLSRHVYEPRGIEPSAAREGFVRSVLADFDKLLE